MGRIIYAEDSCPLKSASTVAFFLIVVVACMIVMAFFFMLVVAFFFMVMAFVVVMAFFFVIVMAFFFMLVVAFFFVIVMAFVVVMITKNRALPIGELQHPVDFRQIQSIGRSGYCFKQRLHPRRHIVPHIDHKVRFLQCFSF